jgi:hypothetical protein
MVRVNLEGFFKVEHSESDLALAEIAIANIIEKIGINDTVIFNKEEFIESRVIILIMVVSHSLGIGRIDQLGSIGRKRRQSAYSKEDKCDF